MNTDKKTLPVKYYQKREKREARNLSLLNEINLIVYVNF